LAKRVLNHYRPSLRGYMQALKSKSLPRATSFLLSALLAFPTFAVAQDPPAPQSPSYDPQAASAPAPASGGGWKRVGDQSAQTQTSPDNSAQQPSVDPNGVPVQAPPPGGDPNANGQPGYAQPAGQPGYGQQPSYGQPNQGARQGYPPQQPNNQSYPPVPATLNVPAGVYLTVRINQLLSSDRNQQGDAFSASLLKPLVINGVVVAEPGETLGGHVTEAVKAGHIEGVARLGVQLTDLTLVDGQQIPIRSSLISRSGPTSVGRDVGAIAGTTALGAAVGAAADWGRGAAIGAGAGAAVGIIGVLVTRGHPSVLYPEQTLTFRIEAPLTIATDHAPQAFRYVEPGEYDRPMYGQQPPQIGYNAGAPYPAYPAYAAPAPYYYGSPYPYYGYGYGYGYPYYWGGASFFFGGRYYGGYGRYYGGGYGGRYYGGGYRGGVGAAHFSGGGRVGGSARGGGGGHR
jgi:hypothetical protein